MSDEDDATEKKGGKAVTKATTVRFSDEELKRLAEVVARDQPGSSVRKMFLRALSFMGVGVSYEKVRSLCDLTLDPHLGNMGTALKALKAKAVELDGLSRNVYAIYRASVYNVSLYRYIVDDLVTRGLVTGAAIKNSRDNFLALSGEELKSCFEEGAEILGEPWKNSDHWDGIDVPPPRESQDNDGG